MTDEERKQGEVCTWHRDDFCLMDEDGRESAIWGLARRLHWKMEHLEPTGESWDEISNEERHYCYTCVRAILEEENLVRAALSLPTADYCDVRRGSELGK